ncbi:MAG: hypothetical protein M3Z11_12070 [Candidatus Dormibacteraeota bacterium]|nr:hypothetical protein [Candidatus Dormibacteraeota bacterium]
MNQEEQLVQRLNRFFQDAKSEISVAPPTWEAPGHRRGRWVQPVFASAALAVVVLAAVVGVRMFRDTRSQVRVAITPTVTAVPSATPSATPAPTPTPTPAPTPGPNWVTQRFEVGAPTAMVLDPSAVFALVPNKVARIDRTTSAVTTGTTQPNATGIARTGAGVWIAAGPGTAPAAANSQWLTLIDPTTLQLIQQVHLPGQPGSDLNVGPELAGNSSLLWLAYGSGIYRLDPNNGATLLSKTIPGTAVSMSLDTSGTRLYVGVEVPPGPTGQDLVMEFDASTGAAIASAKTGGGGLRGPHVAAAADGVWVGFATGTQGAVEHRSAATLAVIGSPIRTSNTIHAVVGAGALWLVDGMAQQLTCADSATGAIRASSPETEPAAFAVDTNGAYLGDAAGVAAMQPPAACHG